MNYITKNILAALTLTTTIHAARAGEQASAPVQNTAVVTSNRVIENNPDAATFYKFVSAEALVILPSQVSIGMGMKIPKVGAEVDVFVAADLISMWPGGDRPDNVAVGLRGRLLFNKAKGYFVEISGQDFLLKQDQNGAQLSRTQIGLGQYRRNNSIITISYADTKINPSLKENSPYANDKSLRGILVRWDKKF